MKIYENISACKPKYNPKVSGAMRDLLAKIFVADPDQRLQIFEIKKHALFQEFDFKQPMIERYEQTQAPFVPDQALFNEMANRKSVQEQQTL
mmetsp:Transcript_10156/g.17125  ORF Transcript_10156/g.17125 Transcript_10156/m.17125 type:complete len:92 (-) Transcript_10156:72-347(-)